MTLVQLADSFGVEQNTVTGWVRHEGLPCITERGRWLFDRAEVIAWAAQRGVFARAGFLTLEAPRLRSARRLVPMLHTGGIWRQVAPEAVVAVLTEIVVRLPGATPPIAALLTRRVQGEGGIVWVPVGDGMALCHLRAPVALGRDAGICAVLLLQGTLAVAGADGRPVDRLLFFIAPSPRLHLELLGGLSTALREGALGRAMAAGGADEELFVALAAVEGTAAGEVVGALP